LAWSQPSAPFAINTMSISERDQVDERDELWRLLATLGPRQRAVLVLRFYEDLSEAEIARVLCCTAGTVKSQLPRGLARLRERMPVQGQHIDFWVRCDVTTAVCERAPIQESNGTTDVIDW